MLIYEICVPRSQILKNSAVLESKTSDIREKTNTEFLLWPLNRERSIYVHFVNISMVHRNVLYYVNRKSFYELNRIFLISGAILKNNVV